MNSSRIRMTCGHKICREGISYSMNSSHTNLIYKSIAEKKIPGNIQIVNPYFDVRNMMRKKIKKETAKRVHSKYLIVLSTFNYSTNISFLSHFLRPTPVAIMSTTTTTTTTVTTTTSVLTIRPSPTPQLRTVIERPAV